MIMKKLNIVFLDRATFGNDCKIKKPNFPHNWIEHQLTKKVKYSIELKMQIS